MTIVSTSCVTAAMSQKPGSGVPGQQKTILLDIDGCCVDSTARSPLFKTDHDEFMAQHHTDKQIAAGAFIYGMIMGRADVRPIFITGRDERQRAVTLQILCKMFGPRSYEVWMRATGDYRPAAEVKLEMMIQRGLDPTSVLLAFDDDPEVVAMYRELDIIAYHTALEAY